MVFPSGFIAFYCRGIPEDLPSPVSFRTEPFGTPSDVAAALKKNKYVTFYMCNVCIIVTKMLHLQCQLK